MFGAVCFWIFSRFTIFNYFTTKPVRIAVFLNDFLRAQLTVDLCYSLVGNFHRSFNVRYMLPEIVIIQQVIFGKIVEGINWFLNGINLLGCIDTTGASPFLIPVSSYNELLEAAGEKTIVLGIDEAVFYLNPDFQGSTKEETTTMLNQIAEDARANGKVLISIDGLPITLIPFVPMKGLTADENVKIITALIVSDEVYSEYVNPDTVTVYHNFCIPSETVEADGLMVSIMEARDLLKPSGLYCESYLDNFGRQLFYVISGSYTTLYMGFMLLIIACALLALQFLTQMRETKARYATLSILGARREQMKRSINQQVLWYFLLPLFPACISGTVGICAMQHYLYSNMAKLQQSYPMLLVMALVVVCMLALYGVAIARTANREISKLNWKPNA